jgi:hypothetical protein
MPGYAMGLHIAHCFVRRDFVDTFDGILPCNGVETTVRRVVTVTETGVNVSVEM